MESFQEQLHELELRLLVYLLDGLCLLRYLFIILNLLSSWVENILDRVCQNLDQTLPQQVSFTVKEPKQAADIAVHSFRSQLGEFAEELCDIFDPDCLMG